MLMIFFLSVIAAVALIFGRRGFCHCLCWMAPFMVVGRNISNALNLASLGLKADVEECIDCRRCTRDYPMSLDVNGMVRAGRMESSE